MTRRVPNPTPLAERGQGRPKHVRINLLPGVEVTVFHHDAAGRVVNILAGAVQRQPGTLFRITLPGGETLDVCALPKLRPAQP